MEQDLYSSERDEQRWVHDSSVNHKGKVPLRASTGAWKAALFIIAIEFSERLTYFGIATNLITYLTNVLHQDLKTSAKNVNYWTGVTTVMPLAGGFLADAYTGRFALILLSSLIYVMGLSLFTMSQFIPALKPCHVGMCRPTQPPRKIHVIVFFIAIYCISLGTAGIKPCLESFGADQFDDDHSEERKKKMSYFNWWNMSLCFGLLLGVTVIVYIQGNVSWGAAALVLTITMAVSISIFYTGKCYYRYRLPKGSPFTPLLQVLVAAIRKRRLPSPSNPSLLYEVPRSEKCKGRLLCHTGRFRFLDKAAIIEDKENSNYPQNPWRLSTLTQVEELKLVFGMIPIWLSSLFFGVCMIQAPTFFVKQGAAMNRRIGNIFEIPPATVYAFNAIGTVMAVIFYEKTLVPFLRKLTGDERGMKILQRIGIGMIFSTSSMVIAALIETKRLKSAKAPIFTSVSVFWLIPQNLVLGFGDGFTLVGLQEYFYDQVPDSMRSLGIALYLSVIGVGSFFSSFLIIVVDRVTEKGGKSWIGKDLNGSRLDNFFWLLAALSAMNSLVYVMLARNYTYKNVERNGVVSDCQEMEPIA